MKPLLCVYLRSNIILLCPFDQKGLVDYIEKVYGKIFTVKIKVTIKTIQGVLVKRRGSCEY